MTDPIYIHPIQDCFVQYWPYYNPYIISYLVSRAPSPRTPSGQNNSYLLFSIPPELTKEDILSATITIEAIWWEEGLAIPHTPTIHNLLEYWNYSTLTWFTQPANDPAIAGSLYHAGNGPISSDVTELVKNWITGPNFGMVILPDPPYYSYLKFWSSRGTVPPYITITTPPHTVGEFDPLEIIKIGPL